MSLAYQIFCQDLSYEIIHLWIVYHLDLRLSCHSFSAYPQLRWLINPKLTHPQCHNCSTTKRMVSSEHCFHQNLLKQFCHASQNWWPRPPPTNLRLNPRIGTGPGVGDVWTQAVLEIFSWTLLASLVGVTTVNCYQCSAECSEEPMRLILAGS